MSALAFTILAVLLAGPVAFDPDACDVVLLLMDSRARHCHAGGEYALRRASCERSLAAHL